jgi:hypothetical protein
MDWKERGHSYQLPESADHLLTGYLSGGEGDLLAGIHLGSMLLHTRGGSNTTRLVGAASGRADTKEEEGSDITLHDDNLVHREGTQC